MKREDREDRAKRDALKRALSRVKREAELERKKGAELRVQNEAQRRQLQARTREAELAQKRLSVARQLANDGSPMRSRSRGALRGASRGGSPSASRTPARTPLAVSIFMCLRVSVTACVCVRAAACACVCVAACACWGWVVAIDVTLPACRMCVGYTHTGSPSNSGCCATPMGETPARH